METQEFISKFIESQLIRASKNVEKCAMLSKIRLRDPRTTSVLSVRGLQSAKFSSKFTRKVKASKSERSLIANCDDPVQSILSSQSAATDAVGWFHMQQVLLRSTISNTPKTLHYRRASARGELQLEKNTFLNTLAYHNISIIR